MTAYVIRRLFAVIPVMAVVALFVFFLLRLAPGDPAAIIAGDDATTETIAAVRAKLGLDRPVVEQFAVWLWGLLQGDLGEVSVHDETTLTRNLRPLVDAGWVEVRTGRDRREKWLRITRKGLAKIDEARPHWARAQDRMKGLLPEGVWQNLLTVLPDVANLAARD